MELVVWCYQKFNFVFFVHTNATKIDHMLQYQGKLVLRIAEVVVKANISDFPGVGKKVGKNKNISIDESVDKLPTILPVLELSRSLLMPQSQLPLSIEISSFISLLPELIEGRIIAVIPLLQNETFKNVGCAGKIQEVQFSKDDVKLLVHGLCRFEVLETLSNASGRLRQTKVSYDKYHDDLIQVDCVQNHEELLSAIEKYFKKYSIDRDLSIIKDTPTNVLVSAITMAFPFQPIEKCSLLETASVEEQCNMIIKIITMDCYNHSLASGKTIN